MYWLLLIGLAAGQLTLNLGCGAGDTFCSIFEAVCGDWAQNHIYIANRPDDASCDLAWSDPTFGIQAVLECQSGVGADGCAIPFDLDTFM